MAANYLGKYFAVIIKDPGEEDDGDVVGVCEGDERSPGDLVLELEGNGLLPGTYAVYEITEATFQNFHPGDLGPVEVVGPWPATE